MMLRRINGSEPVTRMRNELDRVFNQLFEGPTFPWSLGRTDSRIFPAINVWESGEKMFVEAELPGFKMDQLEVYAAGDELTIKGNRSGTPEEGVTYHRRERDFGEFSRVLRLPVEVDAEKVEATLKDGVLTIALPKSPAALPRKINVKG